MVYWNKKVSNSNFLYFGIMTNVAQYNNNNSSLFGYQDMINGLL